MPEDEYRRELDIIRGRRVAIAAILTKTEQLRRERRMSKYRLRIARICAQVEKSLVRIDSAISKAEARVFEIESLRLMVQKEENLE